MNKFLRFLLPIVFALLCGACSYKLAGTAQPLPFKTIAVRQVENNSYAPQASSPLTNQIGIRLSQSPAVDLVGVDDADVILEVYLDDYTRRMIAARADDTAIANVMDVTLRATCTLRDRATGTVLFEKIPVSVSSHVVDKGAGFINAEYQNMTVLTGELAKRIVDQVLGVW
jgi:hypothetical protein